MIEILYASPELDNKMRVGLVGGHIKDRQGYHVFLRVFVTFQTVLSVFYFDRKVIVFERVIYFVALFILKNWPAPVQTD